MCENHCPISGSELQRKASSVPSPWAWDWFNSHLTSGGLADVRSFFLGQFKGAKWCSYTVQAGQVKQALTPLAVVERPETLRW
jgi:hypothetical protein